MAESSAPKKCPPIHDVGEEDDKDGDKKMSASQDPANNCEEGLEKLSLSEFDNRFSDLVRPIEGIDFVNYKDERQIDDIMTLVGRDLSEPYSIFTYRYFLHQWPNLCILAMSKGESIGCIVCKIDEEEVQEYVDVVVEEGEKTAAAGLEKTAAASLEKIAAGFENRPQTTSSSNMDMPPPSGRTRTVTKLVSTIVKHGYIGMLAVDKAYRKHGIGKSLVNRALLRMLDSGCTSVVLETEISNKGALRLYENLGFIREEFLMKYYLNWGDAYRLRLWYDV